MDLTFMNSDDVIFQAQGNLGLHRISPWSEWDTLRFEVVSLINRR